MSRDVPLVLLTFVAAFTGGLFLGAGTVTLLRKAINDAAIA